jgi:hypothetical protein
LVQTRYRLERKLYFINWGVVGHLDSMSRIGVMLAE